MKKIFFALLVAVFLVPLVAAHSGDIDVSTLKSCALGEVEFEALGDYAMEQMIGDHGAHEQMEDAMGENSTRAMHIMMGHMWNNCNDKVDYSTVDMKMMPMMMRMMMSSQMMGPASGNATAAQQQNFLLIAIIILLAVIAVILFNKVLFKK